MIHKILNFVCICIIVMSLVSCNEDWLRPQPLSFYAPENVYKDEGGFRAAINTLKIDFKNECYGNQPFMMLEFASSDLAIPGDQPDWSVLTPSGSLYKYLSMFNSVYQFIKNCNVIITRIDDIEWTDISSRNEILASALFYRSYWYYRLVYSYGDVPWVGSELTGAKLDFKTHSRWVILEKLQEDLEFAADWLYDDPDPGDPSKYAALHLLTKVNLALTEFDKAIETSSKIINGPFALMTDRFGSYKDDPSRNVIWDLHRVENKNIPENTETILAIVDRFDAPASAKSAGTFLSRTYVPHWWSIEDESGARGFDWTNAQGDTLGQGNHDVNANYFHSHGIWNEFGYNWETTPDLRRADINWIEPHELIFSVPTSPNYGEPAKLEHFSNLDDTNFVWRAWPFYKTYMPPEFGKPDGRPRGGNGDLYIFRLAETYLLRAEAYYWKGQIQEATNDINSVRRRANAIDASPESIDIEYIFHERARELYTEETRHSEMVRVSNIMAKMNSNGYTLENLHEKNWYFDRVMEYNNWYSEPKYSRRGGAKANIFPYNIYWPIPQSIITANTLGTINQNIGYQGAENNEPPSEVIE